jgi:hypothetical protein
MARRAFAARMHRALIFMCATGHPRARGALPTGTLRPCTRRERDDGNDSGKTRGQRPHTPRMLDFRCGVKRVVFFHVGTPQTSVTAHQSHLVHNPRVRRVLAACVLMLFAALATTDMLACPDGCRTASSTASADQCNATGQCVFCGAAVVLYPPPLPVEPMTGPLAVQDAPQPKPPFQPPLAPDHPPRLI